MRQLYLIRHAKSDWEDPTLTDFDRPLNQRGLRVAPKMGKMLREKEVFPDLIVSSPAVRAKATTLLLCEQIGYDEAHVEWNREIYEASVRSLLQLINEQEDTNRSIFLVGHNPAFSYISEYLSDAEIGNMPTCGIVRLDFELPWSQVSQSTASLGAFWYPKMFDF